ncbi:TonB-dependent receptor domain-containing protein, partial [Achromobacter dolens]
QPLNQLPKHLFTTTVNWQASDALEAWARVNYRGKESQPITGPSSTSLVAPSYTFVDLGGSYAVNKKVSVYAGIYNLFDKQVGYDDYGYVEDGRRYWLGVGVKF